MEGKTGSLPHSAPPIDTSKVPSSLETHRGRETALTVSIHELTIVSNPVRFKLSVLYFSFLETISLHSPRS